MNKDNKTPLKPDRSRLTLLLGLSTAAASGPAEHRACAAPARRRRARPRRNADARHGLRGVILADRQPEVATAAVAVAAAIDVVARLPGRASLPPCREEARPHHIHAGAAGVGSGQDFSARDRPRVRSGATR